MTCERCATLAELDPSDLLDIAVRMSQELQEFIDEGVEGGSEMEGPKQLLEEFHTLYQKTNLSWQKQYAQAPDDGATVKLD